MPSPTPAETKAAWLKIEWVRTPKGHISKASTENAMKLIKYCAYVGGQTIRAFLEETPHHPVDLAYEIYSTTAILPTAKAITNASEEIELDLKRAGKWR